MLGDAAQYISYAVSNTCPLPTLFISQRPNNCPKQHRGPKTSNKQLPNVPLPITILTVEVVHIRTLQPVPSHHKRVDEKVIVLKGSEGSRRIDPILACFAELQRCHHRSEPPEHQKVEHLHCRTRFKKLIFRQKDSSKGSYNLQQSFVS